MNDKLTIQCRAVHLRLIEGLGTAYPLVYLLHFTLVKHYDDRFVQFLDVNMYYKGNLIREAGKLPAEKLDDSAPSGRYPSRLGSPR